MPPLAVEHLTKRYGAVTAVDDVSFTVEDGEFFFLLGPSGCGKTTLLRTIAGFLSPDEGSIHLGDRDLTVTPPHRRDTAMVFQNYALWPHMTVNANVRYGLEVRRLKRREIAERVREVLEMVRMPDLGDRRPAQLSGGQQQRVALARALAVRPSLLLLDEPLSNLDARLRMDMRNELRRIHALTGVTAIYVTHDQKEALSMAQRMAVMEDGKVVQIGTPTEIYRRPETSFVARFMGRTNLIEGRITGQKRGGHVIVDTALGEFAVEPGAALQSGSVMLSIRPESLTAADADAVNRITGVVGEATYLGETQEFVLTARRERSDAPPLEIVVMLANPGGSSPRTGESLTVSFSPRDVVLLPSEA